MRGEFEIEGRRLSYLDPGGSGRPLLALHGGLSEAAHFAGLTAALGDEWRVIAPDQRGHGDSDRAADYPREGFVADAVALLDRLGVEGPLPVLGFSMGALNAYHLAAARPDLVSALINVDGTVEVPEGAAESPAVDFLRTLPYTADTAEELIAACGPHGPAIAPFLRPVPGGGVRLPFHPGDTLRIVALAGGSYREVWRAGTCPALLVHGRRSDSLPQEVADAMVADRPGTTYVGLDTDHYVPFQDPEGFHRAVAGFLSGLPGRR